MTAPLRRHHHPTEVATGRSTAAVAVSSHALRMAADLTAVLAAFALSYHLYTGLIATGVIDRPLPNQATYLGIAVVIGLISVITFWNLGAYRARASVLNLWEFQVAVKGYILTAAFFFALLFITNGKYSRIVIGLGLVIALLIILLERRVLGGLQRKLQVSGKMGRRVLIYGCGDAGTLLMKKIVQAPHVGRTVVGFIDDTTARGRMIECRITQTDRTVFCAPVLGKLTDLRVLVHQHDIDELFVTTSACEASRFPEILDLVQESDLQVAFVPQLGDVRVDQLQVEDLSAIPVLRPHVLPSRPLYVFAKRLVDVSVASVLLIMTFPLWAVAAALVRLSGPGPILFSQKRIGLNGEAFDILKFRTMRTDASPYATSPTNDSDPRITRVGRILRTAGLDELPQLINVIRGEMSLVGPRPEMPFIVDKYTPLERQRLWAKPGITGLWQLSADRADAIHANLEYDLHYIRHQSLVLDALVLLETLFFTIEIMVKKTTRGLARRFGRVFTRPHHVAEPLGRPTLVSAEAGASTGIGIGRTRRLHAHDTTLHDTRRSSSLRAHHDSRTLGSQE